MWPHVSIHFRLGQEWEPLKREERRLRLELLSEKICQNGTWRDNALRLKDFQRYLQSKEVCCANSCEVCAVCSQIGNFVEALIAEHADFVREARYIHIPLEVSRVRRG